MSLLILVRCQGVRADTTDPKILDQLGNSDKVARVEALLDERDNALRNFSVHVDEYDENVKTSSGSAVMMASASFDERRIEGKYWMHLMVNYMNGQSEDAVMGWDGRMSRDFSRHSELAHPIGDITDSPNGNFTYRAYNQSLVFAPVQEVTTFAQWIRDRVKSGDKIEVVSTSEKQAALLRISIFDSPYRRRSLFLDTKRGNMPVRFEYRYELKDAFNYTTTSVEEARQTAGGLWFPTKVVWRSGTSAVPGIETRRIFTARDILLGHVTDADVVVTFPTGTVVIDRVARISYRVLGNGTVENLPLFDPGAGKMLSAPSSRPLTADVDQSIARENFESPDSDKIRHFLLLVSFLCVCCLLICAVTVIRYKRRSRSNAG